MHTRDYDVDDHHHVEIGIDCDYENVIEIDYNDDDGVDMIFGPVMVNDENYVHLIGDMMLFERPYKFQVLVYVHVLLPNSQYVNDDDPVPKNSMLL